ncbi:MAG: asparagine--tRNA ligase [Candidatus Peribacteraceae bacterium]|jgi:asparaginyl-tRNA synthetase
MQATKISVSSARKPESIGQHVLIQGWVRTRRDSKGGFSFLDINDGSSLHGLQVIAEKSLPDYESEVLKLMTGCSVSVEGTVTKSVGGEQATELKAEKLTVHGWADETFPLQKKRHSFEVLREWAHLRPRTNTFGALLRVRNCVCRSIHNFFQEEGFLYVHTPIISTSDCEGAGQMFRVTTLDAEKPPRTEEGGVDHAQDFFGKQAFLTVSGQLEGEACATAMGKIYTFGPTFRAENSNTTRHLAEFWMIEPEMAFCDLEGDMDLAERFLRRICGDVLAQCAEDVAFFNERIDTTVLETLKAMSTSSFARMSYTEAIEVLQKSGKSFEFPVEWGTDLQSEHERYLAEEHCKKPVILYDYPRALKAFYMRLNEDGKTVRAMDVLAPKVGEIIGGSQREERLEVLEKRMVEQGLNPKDYWWYLDLRRYGTVPHAGFGLGLERLVQFITGMGNIRDVIPFPRTPGNAEF